MSSYWAGYYGAALILNETEFEDFINNYIKRLGITRETFDIEFFDNGVREIPWLRSDAKSITELGNNLVDFFDIIDIDTDTCEGIHFTPFMVNKIPNTYKTQPDNKVLSIRFNETVYAIFADKDLDGPNCFIEKPYESYDAFVQEFKDKIEKYVPEDFDWDAHLGNISYAAYA